MHVVPAYTLPLASIGLVLLLLWWETSFAPPPPDILLCLNPGDGAAAERLEGQVRVFVWTAQWRGQAPGIVLLASPATPVAREIVRRLGRMYPYLIVYRP